jgi:hypothetical protein
MDLSRFLPAAEMQQEFEKFKALKTQEEIEAFKKERKANYDRLTPEEQAAYRTAAKAGTGATIEACNDFIARAGKAILCDKPGELQKVF